jgi:hypothetical protein
MQSSQGKVFNFIVCIIKQLHKKDEMRYLIEESNPKSFKFEEIGKWWLSSKPDEKLPGQLSFNYEEGIFLTLYGNFDEKATNHPMGTTILGESAHGEMISIHFAYLIESTRPAFDSRGGESRFHSWIGHIGNHLIEPESVKINRIDFYLTNFEDWINQDILEWSFDRQGAAIIYKRPKDICFKIDTGINLRFWSQHKTSNASKTATNPSISHRTKISFEFEDNHLFNEISSLIVHFKYILSLALMIPVYEYGLVGFVQGHRSENEGEQQNQQINILRQQPNIFNPRKIHFFQMLFSYEDIQENLEEYLQTWFSKREDLEPVFDLFFGSYYGKNSNEISKFLNYVQALETYHLRKYPQFVENEDFHSERTKSIIKSCPDEYKEWLVSHLGPWTNHKNLHQKLEDLINNYPNPVRGMRGDINSFIKDVKDSRNYYTHWDPSMKSKSNTGGYLKGLSMILGLMIEAFLCIEMGMGREFVEDKQRHRRKMPSVWY